MGEEHAITGSRIPHRSARRVFAALLMVFCVARLSEAQAEEPASARTLPAFAEGTAQPLAIPASSRRLPPLEPPVDNAVQFAAAVLPQAGLITGQPVNYITAAPGDALTANSNPLTVLTPGQPFIRFSALQDEQNAQDAQPQNAQEGGQQAQQPEQTYGQAPTNNSLQFLRDVDVLLAPGAWQFDTGFVYTHFANDFPLAIVDPVGGDVTGVQEAEVRRRLLYTPLAFRYGLTTNVQFFSFLPVGFSNTQISTLGASETQNVSGLGDLNLGVSVHLFDGEEQMPDVIGTFGCTAPTGKFDAPLFGLVPGSNLGQGFWAYNAQLLFINRYDPVIVFYGGGYRHLYERTFEGQLVTPGEQANYMLGVGFAINDRVTLSSTFQGFYITNTFINDVNVRGSNLEPLSMRFAATIVRNCRIIEPFVQIGATDAAPRVNVGVVVTFY